MLQGIKNHPAFQFIPDSSRVKLYISVFAELKMAATAACVKEPNVLKRCCNPLNIRVQLPRKTETCVTVDDKKGT
jgi:hypothetical protein